ncbi:MAG: AAA family ATPase, partial [Spirochaetes bacterium]|nr:AAA family ATPase [Spirochaetota bacterium]
MIEREILNEVKNWLHEDRIIIIKGARQTGKTTLLLYLKLQLEQSAEKTAYFSIDRELFNPLFKSPELFFKFLKQQFSIKNSERLYLFLDEFQYLSDPGLFLKVLFDSFKTNLKIIVSGSSSL